MFRNIMTFSPGSQILKSQYGTKSFKPLENEATQNSEKTIKIRENIRQIKENTHEQEENCPKISENKFLEEINDIGTVYLDQNTYDYYDQSDSITPPIKEKLLTILLGYNIRRIF
ncbi:hypothetical protein BpHYR1_035710 [Brachionus plicatilis]|uniref:Uncharacterized protein n=1 Tax=Brachionus plicatilis TaxID=10195 RepID=A0A3M7QUX9_BRAPC|nr:hypothetical protein BpHYR1_035710 [Brachionus plicatilis]